MSFTRRGFLGTLAATVVGAVAAFKGNAVPPALVFHEDAFCFVMQDVSLDEFRAMYPPSIDAVRGTSNIPTGRFEA